MVINKVLDARKDYSTKVANSSMILPELTVNYQDSLIY
jgi:hypothetical protein